MSTTTQIDPQQDAKHDLKHDPKRRALGRGLESLLPARPSAPQPAQPVAVTAAFAGEPFELDVALIERNPYQTRIHFDPDKLAELGASIRTCGVVQPILVRPGKDGHYMLISGERRLLASRLVGNATIPAVVREVTNAQALEMTIVENLQREDLNPMEQARAFQRLGQEFLMTQEQMAARTGKDRTSITNFLRLLRLPEQVQQRLETGELSFGHARALLALESEEAILAAARKVLALQLSVRSAESLVQGMLNPEAKAQKPVTSVDPNVREAEDQLRRSLGLKVIIEDKKGRGKVIIEYSGVQDFDAILTALGERNGERA